MPSVTYDEYRRQFLNSNPEYIDAYIRAWDEIVSRMDAVFLEGTQWAVEKTPDPVDCKIEKCELSDGWALINGQLVKTL